MNEALVAHCGCGLLNYTSLQAQNDVYPGDDPLLRVLQEARKHGEQTGHKVEIHGLLIPERILPAEPEWVDDKARRDKRESPRW